MNILHSFLIVFKHIKMKSCNIIIIIIINYIFYILAYKKLLAGTFCYCPGLCHGHKNNN